MSNIRNSLSKPSLMFWALAVFLVLLFATGGASRADVQSLVILRPVSVIACAMALMTLKSEHIVRRKWLFGAFATVFTIALLHLIPLPPAVWQSLAGRQDLVDVEKMVGLSDNWRPLTVAPMNGWHALFSLFVPVAVLLLGVQLKRDDLFRLLPLLIALAGMSGILGLLQAVGDPQSAFYFYRITNSGSAVGLFANRNHAATLLACLFPMLAVFASTAKGAADEVRFRQLLAAAIAIVVIPLILVTGSRSGLASAVFAIIASVLLYRRPTDVRDVRRGSPKKINAVPILGGLAVISIGLLTYFVSRAEALERLFAEASGEDNRADFWAVSWDLFWKYYPWGSGSGSFVEVYQIIEPTGLLNPFYVNHAHNDWVEIAITFGLVGLIGLVLAFAAFFWRSYDVWRKVDGGRRDIAFARLASVCIAVIALASIFDYPLRTPTMMGVFTIFTLWLTEAGSDRSNFSKVNREAI